MRRWTYLALGAALAACGGSSGSGNGSTNGGSDGGTSGGGDASSTTGDSGGGGGGDSGGGSDSGGGGNDGGVPSGDAGGAGTVSGSPDGTSFGNIGASYWLGAPDSPSTTVIYIFSNPIKCSEITSVGWDTRITSGTKVLEMKMFGTTAATYNVTTSMTPAPGEASINYVVTSASPTERFGSGGTVTLTKLNANTDATGTFALKWNNNNVTGTFDAVYCAGGKEP